MAETETRPRRWQFFSRWDRDETLVRLETISRPRRRDRDHNPAYNIFNDIKAARVSINTRTCTCTWSWQKKSLQQANITKLMKTMLNVSTLRTNDQQQLFRPLVNSSIDLFVADHVQATVQDFFLMVNVSDHLTINQLLKSIPNCIIQWVR